MVGQMQEETKLCQGWCGPDPHSNERLRGRKLCRECETLSSALKRGGHLVGRQLEPPCELCGQTFTISKGSRAPIKYCGKRCQSRASRLQRLYGINASEFRARWNAQAGYCASKGCLTRLSLESPHGCHVDHDHGTGKVRGLLCGDCNIAEAGYTKAIKRGIPEYLAQFD